jgi:hypothetical protein
MIIGQQQQCQIMLDSSPIGTPFIFLFPFVKWLDVTGDGTAELVVSAYSGRYGALEGEKECVHERVVIFEVRDASVQELTNIIGCLWKPDLFGVRLENVDEDNALEIIAGGQRVVPNQWARRGFSWYELNDYDDIYDWNGNQFVFEKTQLRQPNVGN